MVTINFDSKYEFQAYKPANIFKIKASRLNKLLHSINETSDTMTILSSTNSLSLSASDIEIQPDIKFI